MKKPGPLLVLYVIITVLSIIVVFTDYEFSSLLSFLNLLLPLASLIVIPTLLFRYYLNNNRIKNPFLETLTNFLTGTGCFGLTVGIFLFSFLVFDPGSSESLYSPDGVKITYVDRSVLFLTDIRIYRDYGIVRRFLNRSLNTDDAINPLKNGQYEIEWKEDGLIMHYPFDSMHKREKWQTLEVYY